MSSRARIVCCAGIVCCARGPCMCGSVCLCYVSGRFDFLSSCEVCLLEQGHLSIRSMARFFGIFLTHVVVAASYQSTPPGAKAGLYGDVVAHSDYTLKLQPPEESTHDVEASLDAIMKVEDEKRILSDTEFAAAKQRLLNVGKQQIHDIIREAFESTVSS